MNWARWVLVAVCALFLCGLAIFLMLLPPYLPAAPKSDFIISQVTVFNPGLGRRSGQSIVVKDGMITDVRDARSDDPPPVCRDCIVMPGLSDAHVHTPPQIALGNQRLFALMYLAYGVTSVRDTGQSDASVAHWAHRVNTGQELGPRIYRCGPVVEGVEPGWPSAVSVLSPRDAAAAVDQIAASGADCVKLYNHVGAPEYQAIRLAAARHGIPVIGHVPHKVGLRGVNDFDAQHLTGFPYLHRQPTWKTDLEDADLNAMTQAQIVEAVAVSLDRRIALTPTIVNLKMRLTASDPARFPAPEATRYLPGFWSMVWPSLVGSPRGEGAIAERLKAIVQAQQIVRAAREAGVDVLAGTDVLMPWTLPGDALHREIAYLAEAFDSNEAALESATRINGKHIDKGRVGEIAPGKRAHMLIMSEDPVTDLAALRRWRLAIVDGRIYERAAIDSALLLYESHFDSPLYRWTFGQVVALLTGSYSTRTGRPN